MKFFNFPITNLLILNLLIFTFGFVNLNSQNHTIFLYGSIDGEYNKKDMQFLYTNIAQEIIANGGTTEFWPKIKTKKSVLKRNGLRGFCNHQEISRVYRFLITNFYYRQLRKQIIENYGKTGEKVNIIAIGDGIKVLKYFLQTFYEMELNCINKAIIIEKEKMRFDHSLREHIPARIVFSEKRLSRTLGREYLQEDEELYLSNTEDHYSDEEEPNTDLSDKVVVINAQEYTELLEQQEEGCCCKFFTADRIKALTGLVAVVLPILLAA